MSIYPKRRKRKWLKNTFLILFVITLIIIFSYYFFIPKSFKNFNKESMNENVSNLKNISETTEEKSINLNDYVKRTELEQILVNFINDNPKLLLEVLREYQNKLNELEQEKINKENFSNIEKLKSTQFTMFIGKNDSDKIIFEFVDYNCGYCLKFHNEIMNVMAQDPSLKLVIIQMPILGKMSEELSKIVIASSLQGKFNEVHSYLYSSKRKQNIESILSDLFLMNIDINQLEEDLGSEIISDIYTKHKKFVDDFKFTGTPAVIIGNTIIPGFIEADKILEILEKEFS